MEEIVFGVRESDVPSMTNGVYMYRMPFDSIPDYRRRSSRVGETKWRKWRINKVADEPGRVRSEGSRDNRVENQACGTEGEQIDKTEENQSN